MVRETIPISVPPFRRSTNEAETTQAKIEDEKWVDCNPHTVLDHSTAAQNADTSSQGPCNKNNEDRDSSNPR